MSLPPRISALLLGLSRVLRRLGLGQAGPRELALLVGGGIVWVGLVVAGLVLIVWLPSSKHSLAGLSLWLVAGTLLMAAPGLIRTPPEKPQGPGGPLPTDAQIGVYFAEGPAAVYQVRQWIPVLRALDAQHRVILVVRQEAAAREIRRMTTLPMVVLPRFAQLAEFYDANALQLVLYVNNGFRNFQSLSHADALHVHINHGESDKASMVSNQAKAYDRLFVAGPAAIERHEAGLLSFDPERLVVIGRPQLDFAGAPAPRADGRRVVLYTPTWEGENDLNNFTSLDRYGVAIVEAVLARDDLVLLYRPHPRVGAFSAAVAAAHQQVVATIQQHAAKGHRVDQDSDILDLLPRADLLISDVSSVTSDFVYLRTECPILLTDRRNDVARLVEASPLAAVTTVIDKRNAGRLGEVIDRALREDDHAADRRRLREHYFGDLLPGESTQRFIRACEALMAERAEALERRSRAVARHKEAQT